MTELGSVVIERDFSAQSIYREVYAPYNQNRLNRVYECHFLIPLRNDASLLYS